MFVVACDDEGSSTVDGGYGVFGDELGCFVEED